MGQNEISLGRPCCLSAGPGAVGLALNRSQLVSVRSAEIDSDVRRNRADQVGKTCVAHVRSCIERS